MVDDSCLLCEPPEGLSCGEDHLFTVANPRGGSYKIVAHVGIVPFIHARLLREAACYEKGVLINRSHHTYLSDSRIFHYMTEHAVEILTQLQARLDATMRFRLREGIAG